MSRREPIRKEASGRYLVVLDTAAPGERRRQTKRRFDTYKEARAWLARARTELEEQRFVRPHRTTLAEHVEAWLPVLRTQVRTSTAASYERNLRLHVLPTLGSRRVQSIRPADLSALYAKLLSEGRLDHRRDSVGGLSHRSVAYVHTILGKCLQYAVDEAELIQANPARKVRAPKTRSQAMQHAAMRTWTAEQLGTFLAATRDHRHYAPWLLLATTGLRRGEALGLAWSDLDLDYRRLTVRRILADVERGVPVWSDPKTNRGRRQVSLDPATVAALRQLRATQAEERLAVGPGYAPHDLVFARPDGGPIHPDRFSKAFVERGARLDLPAIRLHDLRHTWATLALLERVHPKVVQERLGHSSIAITMDIYSHVWPAMESDAADLVARKILGDAQ